MSKKFKVGDSVFAPMIGIGLIEERRKIQVAGTELEVFEISYNVASYRTKSFSANKQSVPVLKADAQLLPIATNQDLLKAFKVISEPSTRQNMMWNKRSDHYQEALKTGDLLQIAKVYRDARRNGLEEENLSYAEREIRDEALACMAVQLAFNTKSSRVAAAIFITEIANGSISLVDAKKAVEKGELTFAQPAPLPEQPVVTPADEPKEEIPAVTASEQFGRQSGHITKPIAFGSPSRLMALKESETSQGKLITPANIQTDGKDQNQDIKPNASVLKIPLGVVFKMKMIDEETFFDLKCSKKPPETLGDIFHYVAGDNWPEKASTIFGLDEDRAQRVKESLAKAARGLSLIVK